MAIKCNKSLQSFVKCVVIAIRDAIVSIGIKLFLNAISSTGTDTTYHPIPTQEYTVYSPLNVLIVYIIVGNIYMSNQIITAIKINATFIPKLNDLKINYT